MYNFFGDPYTMWHDDIDPTSAKVLKGEEREKGEEMLIESMKEGSFWAPMGLREMGSKKAVPEMKEIIDHSYDRLQLEIAYALNVLEKTIEYVPHIIQILKNSGSWNRMVAARMLRHYNTPEVVEALFASVEDLDYLVRNHSCESLLTIYGLPASTSEYKEIFADIIFHYDLEDEESMKKARKRYKRAAEMLRDLIDKECK
jgi:HEAT repeat protein